MSRSHTAIRLAWEAKINSSEVSYHVNMAKRKQDAADTPTILKFFHASSPNPSDSSSSEGEEVKQTRSSGSAVQSSESATRAHPSD